MKIKWMMAAALPIVTLLPATAQTVHVQTTPHAAGTFVSAKTSYLGIGVVDIDAERAKALNLKEVRGAEVTKVYDDSPAAKAGIKQGDVILEYNGQSVEGYEQLMRMVRETPVGHQARIVLSRNGASQTVTATLDAGKNAFAYWGDSSSGSWCFPVPATPMPPMPPMDIPRIETVYRNPALGIYGESLNEKTQFADFLGVTEGVLVKEVVKNSAAEKAGIKAGDVIQKVDETKVSTNREITTALRAARGKKTVNVTLIRSKKEMQIPVTLETSGERAMWRIEGPVVVSVGLPRIQIETTVPIFRTRLLKLAPRDGVI
jgi:serine protease Do